MSSSHFLELFIDLINDYLHSKNGGDLLYGETIKTPKGTFDVELKIIEYNNN